MKTPYSPFFTVAGTLLAVIPSCPAALEQWQSAVEQGTLPVMTQFETVSGMAPLVVDVGPLDGDRSFEFIVNAGETGASTALMGIGGTGNQGLKFEQWNNTGMFGVTDFGVVDIVSEAPSIHNEDTHVVFTSDGVDTLLYVNGELAYTIEERALSGTDLQGLAGISNAEGTAFSDPLDGSVLGFASYDTALSAEEIAAHYNAFVQGRAAVYPDRWRQAVAAGTAPAATHFETVSGRAPLAFDVGPLEGDRTVEFIVNAGAAGASTALLGLEGAQGLKFEQWNNTERLGLTQFGVEDFDSGVPAPLNTPVLVAYASDGTDTRLYVNGELQHTFEDTALQASGMQGIAGVWRPDPAPVLGDALPGRIFGFASYPSALSAEEIALHSAAVAADNGEEVFTEWQAATATGTAPAVTRFEIVESNAPAVLDVGELDGPRSFEFIVNAAGSARAAALMGSALEEGGRQNLKFEQWDDTGNFGITVPGVADHDSGVPIPDGVTAHVVFTSDGTDTLLYVDGELQHTFAGVSLALTGRQALGAQITGLLPEFFDVLDGHVLGFASYNTELSAEELAEHYAAFSGASSGGQAAFGITSVSRAAVTGDITLSWNSEPGASYQILYSENLNAFPGTAVEKTDASAVGTMTTLTFANPAPAATRLFFRVRRLAP